MKWREFFKVYARTGAANLTRSGAVIRRAPSSWGPGDPLRRRLVLGGLESGTQCCFCSGTSSKLQETATKRQCSKKKHLEAGGYGKTSYVLWRYRVQSLSLIFYCCGKFYTAKKLQPCHESSNDEKLQNIMCGERVWKGPVQSNRIRIGLAMAKASKAPTPICLHCSSREYETLTHVTGVCPKFREARTSAHIQVRRVIITFVARNIRRKWKMFEESSIMNPPLDRY